MIGLLIPALLFPFVGRALSRFLGPLSSYLGGLGAVGIALWIGGLLRIPLIATLTIVMLGTVSVLVKFRDQPRPSSVRFPLWANLAVVVPALALLFVTAITPYLDYDGIAFWLLKGKAIAHEGTIDGPFFTGRGTFSPRNQYPLLMPLDGAAIRTLAPGTDDMDINWLYPLVLVAFALEVRRKLSSVTSVSAAAWSATILMWLPQFVIQPEGGAMSAYSDIAFAAFSACAFFELIEPESPARFGFWLACVVLTKSEGLPYSLILLCVGVAVFRRRAAGPIVSTLTAIGTLMLWRSRIVQTDEEDLFGRLALLPQNLGRLPAAVAGFAKYAAAWQAWGLFWLAVLAAIAVLAWRRQWEALTVTAGSTLPLFAVYCAVYMVTAWSLPELLAVSAARLLMHFAGPALFLIAAAMSASTQRHSSVAPQ
jgi:hypothetical protein